MKITVAVNNCPPASADSPLGWYLVADSGMSNTGKPFYLPDSPDGTSAFLCVAIRFSRLGKSIQKKFASRYYFEFAPALHFVNEGELSRLRKEGLPADPARSFDRCLMVGEFRNFDRNEKLSLLINGEQTVTFSLQDLYIPVDEIIERISKLNTVKMGDILIPGLPEGMKIKEGDILEVEANGSHEFKVKVK